MMHSYSFTALFKQKDDIVLILVVMDDALVPANEVVFDHDTIMS